MKLKLFTGLAVIAIIGLTACNESAKLAGEVEGTWSADKTDITSMQKPSKDKQHDGKDAPRGMRPEMKPSLAFAPTITFTRASGTNGGDLSISAVYEVTQGVAVTDTVAPAPVKATVSGTVTAQGTWTVKDDDEIAVTIDPAKTVVNVDPSSLTLDYAMLTDASPAGLESIKAKVAGNITAAVTPMLQQRIAKLHEFDDVKVTGNTMKMEIGKAKFNFTKK